MPFPVAAAIGAGATILGGILGRPKKRKRVDYGAIANKYLGMRPEGYVTGADKAAAEATRTRIAGGVQNAARGRRMRATRSLAARGLNSSPVALAAETAIGQDEALGLEEAARTASAQEYDAYGTNRGYMQGMVSRAFGGELQAAMDENRRNDERESTFWNSMLGTIPGVASLFATQPALAGEPGAAGTYGTGGRAGFDPRVRVPARRG